MIEMLEGQDQNHFSRKQDHSAKGKQTEGHLLRRKRQLFILVSLFCVRGGWRGGSRESSGGLKSWYWVWGFKERAMGGEGSFLPGLDPLGGGVGRTSSGEEKGWNWKGTRDDGPPGWGGEWPAERAPPVQDREEWGGGGLDQPSRAPR